ncbi:MAG: 30S ribosomal protein S20 [Pirellulaceae bacterium]
MPNTKSAKKRLRQSEVRRQRNKAVKTSLRSQIRKVRAAVAAGEIETAEQEFVLTARKLDRAGSRYIIHRNTASRLKSRLQKLIRKAKQPAAAG